MEPEHNCKYEARIAVMETQVETAVANTKEILKILKGDNGEGLSTKVAINDRAIKRLWWWVGGLSLAFVLYGSIKHLV